ncbi:cytochrome P450 2K3-like isoform X1 [Anarrhichthys ocellatus]|uniref:cytochrome P450 2K3-like isoform X1 n=1 Tax=Anarrhichthys ocellatus TaxID=433405 RepID=UPI0012ED178C|nr:cytochrome P450 2K3-like isoform X1 [Anarrhichthys ocellatus]
MGMLDLLLQSSSSVSLLGALVVLLLVYLVSSFSFSSQGDRKEPPGPKPLPILGNLLLLDLKRPYNTLQKLSKKYGSVFTFYMGPQIVVVLSGYKTVKEALVNHADEFRDRDQKQIQHEFNQGHGKERKTEKISSLKLYHLAKPLPILLTHFYSGILWSNGDSWKEMRRFALTNLRDFGMGKRAIEEKIIEESQHLIGVLKNFKGEAFDTTQPIRFAVSNIICSMVYGSRFQYDDPDFTSLVYNMSSRNQLFGSPSITVYNMFPWFFKWIANRKLFLGFGAAIKKQNLQLFSRLKETLNPQMCRGFVDAFLVQKQNLEVRKQIY